MPSLDDLGTSQVPNEVPAASDIIPFFDVSELGSSSHIKRTTVGELVGSGLSEVESLTVDHVILSDQTGLTDPANALSQKAGLLHFNNTPVIEFNSTYVTGSHTSNGSEGRTLIGSLPIPATMMANGTSVRFKFNFNITASPKKAFQTWAIWIDFDEGEGMTSGLGICVGETDSGIVYLDGVLKIDGGATTLVPSIHSVTPPLIYGSDAGALATGNIKGKVMSAADSDYLVVTPGVGTAGVANNLNIYVQDISASNTDILTVLGSIGVGAEVEL